jgi:hypothetical protein
VEISLSRIIKTGGAGKDRTQLSRSILLAIQELMRQSEVNDATRDLAAFIALALEAIWTTIDQSVAAWEKRGYWLKADRFRMEWEWTERLGSKMRQATLAEDWTTVAMTAAHVAEKLKDVKLLKRPPKTEPWKGAWETLRSLDRPEV